MTSKKKLELYIHIPFCEKKCAYCDFLSFPSTSDDQVVYVSRLKQELSYYGRQMEGYEVSTVFFGGGTPTVLSGIQIADILHHIKLYFELSPDAEITVECNPGTASFDKMRRLTEAGVNRISLGLQSANNLELAMLGRIHTFEDFMQTFDHVRKAGIRNVNVDLMCGLPGQSPKTWEKTLKTVTSLRPEHISTYGLMIEEGTMFYQLYHKDDELKKKGLIPRLLPSEEADLEMQQVTIDLLGKKGYERYEFSNYARKGRECRHNIGYWTGTDYLGLGLGASSYLEGYRFHNTREWSTYLTQPFEQLDMKHLSKKERMEEFMFLGLRMKQGITRDHFKDRFGVLYDSVYGDVTRELQEQGMLELSEGRIFLTEEGINVSNVVLSRFLLDQ